MTTPRQLADTIQSVTGTTSQALLEAFATVPRERFLPPGPWHVRDAAGARLTADSDPAHVYADVSIAVDLARDLYNGQPSTVAGWLHALAIMPGDRVLHIGCGSTCSTATAPRPCPPTSTSSSFMQGPHTFGRSGWPAAARARMLVPLTVDFAAMGPTLGKGLTFVLQRQDQEWTAKALSFVAIYSMQSARDATEANTLGEAMRRRGWDRVTHLRTDPHAPSDTCWCHWDATCLSR